MAVVARKFMTFPGAKRRAADPHIPMQICGNTRIAIVWVMRSIGSIWLVDRRAHADGRNNCQRRERQYSAVCVIYVWCSAALTHERALFTSMVNTVAYANRATLKFLLL